jgi:hypothetical protein
MYPSELEIHSFIIKIRMMDGDVEAGKLSWYGRITHVPSGEYRHFRELIEIIDFIGAIIDQAGADDMPKNANTGGDST